jgi:pimeloyl-ACP methyl ester carboxylesterase
MHTRRLALIAGSTAALCSCHGTALAAQLARHAPAFVGSDGWRDTTHHAAGFVTVEPDVRIHYLDFGGSGPPVVFLAGLGNTAHAFDDFAPRFTDKFRVIALTRRGFGESSHPSGGYDTPRLVEDIVQVLDSLHLARVTLIGHSIAGEEMTLLAATHPDRVAKLVYLDAAYDRVAEDSMLDAVFPVPLNVPLSPEPDSADTATPAAYVRFVHRTRGVDIPESDIRVRYQYDGWNEELGLGYQSIQVAHPRYAEVRAPALAVYAVTNDVSQLEPWQRSDSAHLDGLRALVTGTEMVLRKSREQFRNEMPHGTVLEIRGGHHWIFVSNRDQVLAAVRKFLLAS